MLGVWDVLGWNQPVGCLSFFGWNESDDKSSRLTGWNHIETISVVDDYQSFRDIVETLSWLVFVLKRLIIQQDRFNIKWQIWCFVPSISVISTHHTQTYHNWMEYRQIFQSKRSIRTESNWRTTCQSPKAYRVSGCCCPMLPPKNLLVGAIIPIRMVENDIILKPPTSKLSRGAHQFDVLEQGESISVC